jgi:Kef-type K+ transport system membrane component KefB
MSDALIWLLQLLIVVGAAHGAGWVAARMGQPRVVGEMAVGLLLGPSLLGRLAPGLSQAVFGAEHLGALSALSQLGLLLFMFLVGLEVRPQQLRQKGGPALAITLSSMLVPLVGGAAVAAALYPLIGDPSVPRLHLALFMGTALSITAFPVLARILAERGLLQSPLGALAIACAAADDLLAWCLLAGVVLLINAAAPAVPLWLMLGGSAAFCAAMLLGGRRLAARLLDPARDGALGGATLTGILLTVIASAALTEWLGIHALFGAFLAGTIMPRHPALLQQLRARLEGLTLAVLLPLFFASVGLRADIGLIQGGPLWLAAGLIVLVAVAGKLGGTTLAARASGMPWRDALGMGALMNTRGLMELVVAGIGLEIGVISPAVFTILVLVAIVTTCMTGPLLDALRITPPQLAPAPEAALRIPVAPAPAAPDSGVTGS